MWSLGRRWGSPVLVFWRECYRSRRVVEISGVVSGGVSGVAKDLGARPPFDLAVGQPDVEILIPISRHEDLPTPMRYASSDRGVRELIQHLKGDQLSVDGRLRAPSTPSGSLAYWSPKN